MELENKTCLIVGASGAIGTAVAERFHREGARLAVTHRGNSPISLKADSPVGARISTFSLDVSSASAVQSVISEINEKMGPIHALVNCSGVQGPIGPVSDVSIDAWIQTIQVNLFGCFYLTRTVVPLMLSAGAGKIIHFSGGGATNARPFFTAYAASKVALVRFTETVAKELHDKNIQINAIAPGAVKSRMWDELRQSVASGGPAAVEELKQMDLTGGVSADRAAGLALFLASNRSNGLSGRLISAVWDKWEQIEPRLSKIMASDAGTLRRLPLDC